LPYQVFNQPGSSVSRYRPEISVVRFDLQVSANEFEQFYPLIASGFEQSPFPSPNKIEVKTGFGVRSTSNQGAVTGRGESRAIRTDSDSILPPRGIGWIDKILVDQRLIEERKGPQIAGFDPGDHPRDRPGGHRINLLADEVEKGFQGIHRTESVQNIILIPIETRQTERRISLGCGCGEYDFLEWADPIFDATL